MSDRPAPLTTTDTYLALVLDELQGLRAALVAGRGGAPATPQPESKQPAAKKTTPKGKRQPNLDGT